MNEGPLRRLLNTSEVLRAHARRWCHGVRARLRTHVHASARSAYRLLRRARMGSLSTPRGSASVHHSSCQGSKLPVSCEAGRSCRSACASTHAGTGSAMPHLRLLRRTVSVAPPGTAAADRGPSGVAAQVTQRRSVGAAAQMRKSVPAATQAHCAPVAAAEACMRSTATASSTTRTRSRRVRQARVRARTRRSAVSAVHHRTQRVGAVGLEHSCGAVLCATSPAWSRRSALRQQALRARRELA